jgi:predicted RNase H-like nuclease (RuvC/YqgF family)
MAFPVVPAVAVAAPVIAAVSIGINIYQAVQNNKLRKQIRQLERINDNLRAEIEERRKELKALKIWCFRQRINLHRDISNNKREIQANNREIWELEREIA